MADTTLTGVYPIDPTSEVGLARIEIGDVVGTPHDPADGKAEYEFFGDAGLAALLAANEDSPELAIGKALNSMAVQLLAAAEDIQVDDIRIKTYERANAMRELAKDYLSGSLSFGGNSGFAIVPISSGSNRFRPQGIPLPSGYDVGF